MAFNMSKMVVQRHHFFRDILSSAEPSSIALSWQEKNRVLFCTYAQLLEKIDAFPLPEERCVGVICENKLETIVAIFALAGKRRLVMLGEHDSLETLSAQVEATGVSKLYGDGELVEELSPYLVADSSKADNDILFFTSGTTSMAKAVVLDEARLCSSAYNGGCMLPLSRKDRFLSLLPLNHVFGFVCALLWPLSFGASVQLGGGVRTIFSDFVFFKPTVTSLVPQMAGFLVAKHLLNPELKLALIGAGSCSDTILNGLKESGIRVSYGYGLTETSSGIALSIGDDPRAMSICPDYELKIANDGEILVRCDTTIMKGYLDAPEATEEVLHDGYLHTGDLGQIKDGFLYLIGRKKEILVFDDGSKLYIPEYEGELATYLPIDTDFAISQAEDGKIVLYIARQHNIRNRIDSFNQHYPLSHKIAKIVVVSEPLPRTASNKVQRYLLPTLKGEFLP